MTPQQQRVTRKVRKALTSHIVTLSALARELENDVGRPELAEAAIRIGQAETWLEVAEKATP